LIPNLKMMKTLLALLAVGIGMTSSIAQS